MLSHGVISGALFLCVGVVYDRMHTREIAAYGGLVNRMPVYAAILMWFTLCNVGLPGTSGFVGEFLSILGTFAVNSTVADAPGKLNQDPYAAWLFRIRPRNATELEGLLDAATYSKTVTTDD